MRRSEEPQSEADTFTGTHAAFFLPGLDSKAMYAVSVAAAVGCQPLQVPPKHDQHGCCTRMHTLPTHGCMHTEHNFIPHTAHCSMRGRSGATLGLCLLRPLLVEEGSSLLTCLVLFHFSSVARDSRLRAHRGRPRTFPLWGTVIEFGFRTNENFFFLTCHFGCPRTGSFLVDKVANTRVRVRPPEPM